MLWVLWFFLAILIGIIANGRGRSGFGYFLLSLILSPLIGGLILLISGTDQKALEAKAASSGELKKCPACAEYIKPDATKCRFCGTEQIPPK